MNHWQQTDRGCRYCGRDVRQDKRYGMDLLGRVYCRTFTCSIVGGAKRRILQWARHMAWRVYVRLDRQLSQ